MSADAPGPAPVQGLPPPAAFAAVTAAFASLGRVCLALDSAFCIRHVSPRLDLLLGAGAAEEVRGRPVAELLGEELFGQGGDLRAALSRGERREGLRGMLGLAAGPRRLVSLTAAVLQHDDSGACDPGAAFLVVVRPAEEEPALPVGQGLDGMVSRSKAMVALSRLIEHLQDSVATVLITGESGTGKEMAARALHRHSPRGDGPFVAVNCAALPSELLESELFGHVRGAFTGAVRDRVGRFEAASTGTLFLDEVGDLPLVLQGKLLRVLQERTFERVGDNTSVKTEARIIAATHQDLRDAVRSGRFREDLYYRLRVVPIELPPLRQRPEDIEPLTRFLLARVMSRAGKNLLLSPDALRLLLAYPYPGNVRELENALEYAVAVCRGQTLLPEDLPLEIVDRGAGPAPREPALAPGPTATPAAQEGRRRPQNLDAETIEAALAANRWNRAAAAAALGVSRTTLWRRIRELGLSV